MLFALTGERGVTFERLAPVLHARGASADELAAAAGGAPGGFGFESGQHETLRDYFADLQDNESPVLGAIARAGVRQQERHFAQAGQREHEHRVHGSL